MTRISWEERFKSYISPCPNTGCWFWTGTGNGDYGFFRKPGGYYYAHRVAYELFNGQIGDGLLVRHSCDVPICVNPDHLLVGTQADNLVDMDARGRRVSSPGESNGQARLTEEIVREIRLYHAASGQSTHSVARHFGISQGQCYRIVRRQAWKHV